MYENLLLALGDPFQIALTKKIALVFFFLFFMGVFLKLVLTRRSSYERVAQIPLNDDVVVEPREQNHG